MITGANVTDIFFCMESPQYWLSKVNLILSIYVVQCILKLRSRHEIIIKVTTKFKTE